MTDESDVTSKRARRLRAERDRISAEIVGVENGVLPLVESAGRPIEPREVAARLGFTPQGANNALAALWRASILDRARVPVNGGGRAYAYRLAFDITALPALDD
jgi:hypothetical protein